MKLKNLYIILCCVLLLVSCKKEAVDGLGTSFIKFVDHPGDFRLSALTLNTDGTFIVGGSSMQTGNSTSSDEDNAFAAKLSAKGETIWKSKLPGILFNIYGAHTFTNGNILLCGVDSVAASNNFGLIVLNQDGDMVNQLVIPNNASFFFDYNWMDVEQLNNGNVAIMAAQANGFDPNTPRIPRLIVVDPELNIISDDLFVTGDVLPLDTRFDNCKFKERMDGGITIVGTTLAPIDTLGTEGNLPFFISTTPPPYQPTSFHVAAIDKTHISSEFVLNDMEEAVWSGASHLSNFKDVSGLGYSPTVGFSTYQRFTYSPEISFGVLNNDTSYAPYQSHSNFKSNGYVQDLIRTSDGGYLMVGSSNQGVDPRVNSNTKVLMIKLDSHRNELWTRTIETAYTSTGNLVREVADGYIVGATHSQLNDEFKIMIVKTDKNGNLL